MIVCKHTWVTEDYGFICTTCGMADPCFEDERSYPGDDWPNDEQDDDEYFDCGWVRGQGCTMAGTEECDWECPHRRDFEKGMRLTQARLAKRAKEKQ